MTIEIARRDFGGRRHSLGPQANHSHNLQKDIIQHNISICYHISIRKILTTRRWIALERPIPMKSFHILAAGIALAFASTTPAGAAIYDFTVHSQNYDIVGEITTNGNQVTSITGQLSGLLTATITGLLDQPNVYFTSDNLFNPTGPYVSNEGILFGAGGYSINIYSVANGGGYTYYIANSQFLGNYYSDPTSAPLFAPGDPILSGTITAVPEISTWAMMILGFAGLAVLGGGRMTRQASRIAA